MSDNVIKVRLKEPTGGTNRTVKISGNVPASKLAPFLARQLKMNMTDEQGQPRSFKISVQIGSWWLPNKPASFRNGRRANTKLATLEIATSFFGDFRIGL